MFRYSHRALELVWTTNRGLTLAFAVLTLIAGALPAAVAYVGSLIVDSRGCGDSRPWRDAARSAHRPVLQFVALEGLLVAAIAGAQRGISLCQSLLRAQLGQRVNVDDPREGADARARRTSRTREFYDKLTRARREASSRPLSLVMRTFGLAQNAISLVELRRAARALLAVRGGRAGARGAARLRRRGEVLRRRVPPVPLAHARDAQADVPRDGDRARGPREGGEAVRPRAAVPRSLSRHLPQALRARIATSRSAATPGASSSA